MLQPTAIDRAFARYTSSTADSPSTPKESTGDRVTAKMSMDSPDKCPYCRTTMTTTICCGQRMYICTNDRAVFPMEDGKVIDT